MATKNIIKEIPTDFDKDLVLTPSAPVPSDIGSGLPAVLEDLAKRELDRPMTRRELFRRGKRAVQIGGGAALDRSKIGDWLIGDDIELPEWEMLDAIAKDLLFRNNRVVEKMDEVFEIFQLDELYGEYSDEIYKEFGDELGSGIDQMLTELGWPGGTPEDGFTEAHVVEDIVIDLLRGDHEGYEPLPEKGRNILNKALPKLRSLTKEVDKRTDVMNDLFKYIKQEIPEIYDIDPDNFYSPSRAKHIEDAITKWVGKQSWSEKYQKEASPTNVSDVINEALKDYSKYLDILGGEGLRKKKEDEAKRRRLIESATDLARRLAAPPTGTVPGGKQVKPPVQETKPPVQQPQPKISAPRATMEQPPEQGRGLSNLARMLPAVGKRLPFVAPAAALLRSRPAGVDADRVPPDPLGTGRVYRNYHDYNPRNI